MADVPSFKVFLDEMSKSRAAEDVSAAEIELAPSERAVVAACASGEPVTLTKIHDATGIGLFELTDVVRNLTKRGLVFTPAEDQVQLTDEGAALIERAKVAGE